MRREHVSRRARSSRRAPMRAVIGGGHRRWSVEDLARALEEEGLEECGKAVRRADIDGRVALSLSKDDEDELRAELGLGLAHRRRLLHFVAQMQMGAKSTDLGERDGGEEGRRF